MRYWVVKGRPAKNNFAEMLVPYDEDPWHTGKTVPSEMTEGDLVFIWASSPRRQLIGLAHFRSRLPEKDNEGRNQFVLRYLTPTIDNPLEMKLLRADTILNALEVPSFLKTAASGTIYPLSASQGERLLALLLSLNPNVSLSSPDVNVYSSDLPEPPIRISTIVSRIVRDTERARTLKDLYGHKCQVCQQAMPVMPGIFYIEAHHIRPLGGPHGGMDEHDNMLVLCPTHHAMFDLSIPRFSSENEIAIYGSAYRLTMRHALKASNIAYHNELYHVRERGNGRAAF